jgi:cell division ATPase FtsA
LIDIGNSLTEVLFFQNNKLRHFTVLEKGARDIVSHDGSLKKEKLNIVLEGILESMPSYRENFISVVVTGGGALLDGVIEEAERILKIRVRMGRAASTGFSLSSQDAMVHTSTIGLINGFAKSYKPDATHKSPIQKAMRRLFDLYESYF